MFRFGIFTGKQKCVTDSSCTGANACDQGFCATKVADVGAPVCKADVDCGVGKRCDILSCTANSDCVSNNCPAVKCSSEADCGGGQCDASGVCAARTCAPACFHYGVPVTVSTPRDSIFRFTTNGSFSPLLVGLSTDPSVLVEPTAITYLPTTQELAVTDGSSAA